jgi:uncharacterized protein (DUF169 family)
MVMGNMSAMAQNNYARPNEALTALLRLTVPPIAISFLESPPGNLPRPGGTMPAPTPDGRTGAVVAGCVFWMMATERAFATVAADHDNCNVGSFTHGFKSLAETAKGADVAALLETRWVTPEAVGQIASVSRKPGAIAYGPLATTAIDPDVVFLRVNAKQVMLLHEACPDLRFEGKPQCHIVALAKEKGDLAVSTGCMLSRVRTGMSNNEMTFAVSGHRLGELIERLKAARAADMQVAAYAAADAKRFTSPG